MGKRSEPGRSSKKAASEKAASEKTGVRTFAKAPRICSIAAPLLIVTRSLDDGPAIERLFGPETGATVVGVFARSNPPAGAVIDLREAPADAAPADAAPAVSLDRVGGDRQHTADIGASIADAIDSIEAATVAISLGLLDGDDIEAADAALVARRRARNRIRWICYSIGDADAARIARRRMSLFLRGVRLEPVAVAEVPMGSSARFWEIRAPHRY